MYSVKDLMNRYGLTRQGVQYFISKNLETINAGGVEHAQQNSEGWQFDEDAIKTIDKLRNFSQVAVLEQAESERIEELKQENENLRQLLIVAQAKLIQAQEELNENQKLMLASEKKILAIEAQSNDLQSKLTLEKTLHDVTKQQAENYKQQLDEFHNQIKEAKAQLDESKENLETLRKRGLFDRIFNNF